MTYIYTASCIACNASLTLLSGSEIGNQQAVPFLLDYQGNGEVKLVVFSGNNRSLYFYNFTSNSYTTKPFSSILNNNVTTFASVNKHFASIIDLNSDCFADLAMVSWIETNNVKFYQLELYQKQANNNYRL